MTGSYFRTGLDLLFVSTMFPRHPFCAFVGLNLIWPMDCLREFEWVGGAPPVETNSPIGRLRTNTCEAESWGFEHNIISVPTLTGRLALLIVVLGVTACFLRSKLNSRFFLEMFAFLSTALTLDVWIQFGCRGSGRQKKIMRTKFEV